MISQKLLRPECLAILEKLSDSSRQDLHRRLNEEGKTVRPDLECIIIELSDVEHLRAVIDKWIEGLSECRINNLDPQQPTHIVASTLLEIDSYLEELEKQQKHIFEELT